MRKADKETNSEEDESFPLASLSGLLLRIFLILLPPVCALHVTSLPREFLLLILVGGFVFSAEISFRTQLLSEFLLAVGDMDAINPGLFSYTT